MALKAKTPKEPKPAKEVKEKAPLTDDQKKTYGLLGFMGFLALITAFIYIPPLFQHPAEPVFVAPAGNTATPELMPPPPGTKPGTPGVHIPLPGEKPGAPGSAAAGAPKPGAPATAMPGAPAAAGLPGAPLAGAPGSASPPASAPGAPPVVQYRVNPFAEMFTSPANIAPTPTPRPPIQLPPPPLTLPAPGSSPGGFNRTLVGLMPPVISRMKTVSTRPSDTTPPRVSTADLGTEAQPASNKRLSGVVIGDGVRALLEINNGQEIVTHVVQPGDEVDGVQVLSIQQVNEGDNVVTRMIVRENGSLQSVDLKAAPQTTSVGGAGSPPGGGG